MNDDTLKKTKRESDRESDPSAKRSNGYVSFTSSGIKVDLNSFFRSASGRRLIKEVSKAGARFEK